MVFQGDVQFQLSRELLYGNNRNEIKSVSIDFLDTKGWQTYPLTEQLIHHHFETTGEVGLYIRLETERGTYITGSKLSIRMPERIKPDEVGSVTAEGKENGRLAEAVLGAEFAIYNGCDGVLNKPIIIAEGFDSNGENGIDDMMGRYHQYFSTFRNHAYDMVYVNYTDGQAAIQDNAQALKRVINEIKNRIPAADSIIYIGASMSGLIGRWALREMENAGQPHKVKLFIGLDAGQQGSYIPPGLVQTRRSLGILGGWKAQVAEMYLPALKTIDAPASKQLLYFHSGTSPHADFYTLKQNLLNMGNGGYPALSRNIAIVNGSLNGVRQLNRWGNTLTPGEELIDVKALTLLGNAFVKAWSNVPGYNTKTFSGISATFATPFAFAVAYAHLPVNYDRLPGGYVQRGIDFKKRWPVLLGGNINISAKPRFTHMPVFSSIDYRGPLNSDADHTFLVAGASAITDIYNQVTNPSLTPFKAIYGNIDFNSEHTYAVDITNALNTLALRELGLNKDERLASCPVLSPPPAPQKATLNSNGTWSYSSLQGGRCPSTLLARPGGNVLTLYVGDSSPDYQQYILITGPNYGPYQMNLIQGRGQWSYEGLPSGLYIIKAVRQYAGTLGTLTTSAVFQIGNNCQSARIAAGECPIDEENGEPIGLLTDTNEQCYAVKVNGVWIAMLDNGTYVSRERLIANGFTTDGANCYAATDPRGSAPASNCPNLGGITYQRWENIGGSTSINDLINGTNGFQNTPTVTQTLSIFEGPTDIADNYGSRIRGYICPPTTGLYTFWVSGDDNTELWLSTDEDPDNSEIQAFIDSWTPSREWSWYSTQRSFPIQLQAGQKYYIEARMKEGQGGDNLAVGWQLPNGSLERPIPGNRLIPFSGSNPTNCNFSVSASNSNGNPSPNQGLQLSYNCSGPDCGSASFVWSGNGTSGNASPYNINAPGSNGTYTYVITASKSGCGNQSASTSISVGSNTSFEQCIEAESSSGNGAITGDPNASGGSTRGEENNYAHYVDYAISNVPSAGTYTVTLQYYASSAPVVNVSANGGSIQTVNLATTGTWNIVWTTQSFTLNLNAGNNTIRIQGTGGGSCRQDKICVSGSGGGPCSPPAPPTLHATNTTINPGGSSTLSYSNCAGTVNWSTGNLVVSPTYTTAYTATCTVNGCTSASASITINVTGSNFEQCIESESSSGNGAITGDPNASGGSTRGEENNYAHYVDYAISNVPSAGTYAVTLQYYASSAPVVNVSANGGSTQTVNLATTGTWNIVWTTQSFTVNLNAGSNTIRIQGTGGGSCRQDKICVTGSGSGLRIGYLENTPEESKGLIAAPNPSNGDFEISFFLAKGTQATLIISDTQGKEVYGRKIAGKGSHRERVKLSSPPGMYLVQLRQGKELLTKKVVVVR